jgi:hypothetical protein
MHSNAAGRARSRTTRMMMDMVAMVAMSLGLASGLAPGFATAQALVPATATANANANATANATDSTRSGPPPAPPRFSDMAPGAAPVGWLPLRPAPDAADTRYTLIREGGAVVMRADADKSMSGLVHAIRVSPAHHPILTWRWRVAAPIEGADMLRRAGDDYAARVYVLFDYPAARLSLADRARLRLGQAIYGQPIPTAAINYVWDNRQPVGTIRPNAYTDRARMVVLQSGAARAGEWVVETRDLAADFRAAFGEDAPDVTAIAIATDTDNTGGQATAWYGDFEFLPRPAARARP